MVHGIEAGHHVTAGGPERERFDGPDQQIPRVSGAAARLPEHGQTPIQADGHDLPGVRCADALHDRVQVPPRARGDVHEPHGSSRVRGASHDVADEAHGTDIQLAQCPIPCRHLGEVVAQPRRAPALLPGVRPRSDLDSQSRRVSRGYPCTVERRTLRRRRCRWRDDKKPCKPATIPAICKPPVLKPCDARGDGEQRKTIPRRRHRRSVQRAPVQRARTFSPCSRNWPCGPTYGVVARIVTGPHDTNRQDPHVPMRYDTGRPRTASLPCPAGLRARRPSPMRDL